MSSKIERLNQLVSFYANGNKAEFSRQIGITKQSLNTWYKNEYIDIEKLFFACPGVSSEWLLTGDGEMLAKDRPVENTSSDVFIPFIHEPNLLSGNWSTKKDGLIMLRGLSYSCHFFTNMINNDLRALGISKGSILACNLVRPEEMDALYIYIVHTAINTHFVELYDVDGDGKNAIYKFTTRRAFQDPDLKLEIPARDILFCAKIESYSVEYDPF